MSNETETPLPVGSDDLVVPLRVLRLTLKKKWFDMIASGEKKEEYRVPGPWINSRIHGKKYDVVEFKNGYGPNVPRMVVEYRGAMHGLGKPEWGGDGEHVLVICLGRVLSLHNEKSPSTGEKGKAND